MDGFASSLFRSAKTSHFRIVKKKRIGNGNGYIGKGKAEKEEWRGKRPLFIIIIVKALSKLGAGLWLEATIVISFFIIFSERCLLKFHFVFLWSFLVSK